VEAEHQSAALAGPDEGERFLLVGAELITFKLRGEAYYTAPVLPVELRAEVAAAYRLLADRCGMDASAVAARSSAVNEDGRDASFAGQHETFLTCGRGGRPHGRHWTLLGIVVP
jgi:pyruvate, water dikinase